MSRLKRMTVSSSRILDAYIAGLQIEVDRLLLMRDNSEEAIWKSQLEMQIELKLRLIDDVSKCIADEDENPHPVEIAYDSLVCMSSSLPSHS